MKNIRKRYNSCCCLLLDVCSLINLNGLGEDLCFGFHNCFCFSVISCFLDNPFSLVVSQFSMLSFNTSQFSLALHRKKIKNENARYRLSYIRNIANGFDVFAPTPVLKFPFPINIMGVHNLTGKDINISILKFLSLGENFIFKPHQLIDHNVMREELLRFHRRVRLRNQFYYNNDTMHEFYSPSPTFQPSRGTADLEHYLSMTLSRFELELNQLELNSSKRLPQLHNSYRICIKSLKVSKELTILKADKGLGFVCVCQSKYVDWILNHLWNDRIYRGIASLPSIPTKFLELETILVNAGMNAKSIVWKYILQERSVVVHWGRLYFLVKVHKHTSPPPLRPICSQLTTVSYFASRYVSKILVPLVKAHVPTFFDDPIFIIEYFLKTKFIDPVVLVAADIENLYPSINIADGLLKMEMFLREFSPDNCALILDLLNFILHNNFFEIEGLFYQQISGVAMGTPCAVMFSVIYIHFLEFDTIQTMEVASRPIFLCRYIDDYFGIFLSVADANSFFQIFNSQNSTITATDIQYSTLDSTGVNFLDFTIKQVSYDPLLQCHLYYKPLVVSHHAYIHYHSRHSVHVKTGFINSELNRFILRCSHRLDYIREFLRFYNVLINRGYPSTFLDETFFQHLIDPVNCTDEEYKGKRLKLISFRLISKNCRQLVTRRPLVYKRKAGSPLNFSAILSTSCIDTAPSFISVFNSRDPIIVNYAQNTLATSIKRRRTDLFI